VNEFFYCDTLCLWLTLLGFLLTVLEFRRISRKNRIDLTDF